MPLLLVLGYGNLPKVFERRVLARNLCETIGVICFVVALANMPIADVTALGQITPLIVLLGAACSLVSGSAGSALLSSAAVCRRTDGGAADRRGHFDLCGARRWPMRCCARCAISPDAVCAGDIPGLIVAISAVSGGARRSEHRASAYRDMGRAGPRHLLLLCGSGLFLVFGHFFIFMAYRVGPTRAVAPFYYCFTVWAVISGLVVFGHLPNTIAALGILLVVASGLTIVLLDQRRRRPVPST